MKGLLLIKKLLLSLAEKPPIQHLYLNTSSYLLIPHYCLIKTNDKNHLAQLVRV